MSEETVLLKPGENIRPVMDIEKGKILVEKLYGLRCSSIFELNGYDDKNYKVIVVDENTIENSYIQNVCKDGYVLKIMNSLDSKKTQFVEAQNALMLYLNHSGIACPKPVKNKTGTYYAIEKLSSGDHAVRLLEFLPGSILSQAPPNPKLFHQIGKYIATLDSKLKHFHHEGFDSYKSLWMLDSVPQLNQFLFAIIDLNRRQIVEKVIRDFENRVLPARKTLEEGLIHGDFNEQNILVEEKVEEAKEEEWNVKGVLDFGDTHHSCYLYELAITITYAMIVGKDLHVGGYVIAGYSTIRQIRDEEFRLLKVCVAARLCQSLVLGAYTSLQDPGNTYTLSTAPAGWNLLERLCSESEEETLKRWRTVAEDYVASNP